MDSPTADRRDTPATEPLGIALYGAWGQGKSTIGELLRGEISSELASRRYVFVRIDAWKYAHEGGPQPLRRHFLIAAYEAAGLTRRARELKRLFGAEFSGAFGRARTPLRKSFRLTLWELLVVLGLVVAVVAVAGDLGKGIHWLRRWGHIVAALGIGGAVLTVIAGVVRDRFRVTAKIDPFGSVEEFEDQLTQLIDEEARASDQRPVERFIFFIDDLDRCRDKLVVEAIETLQAFFGRARCVCIVAADREQLRRAVRHESVGPASVEAQHAAIPADESFLEKIFQVTVEVPPPFGSTLIDYARTLVGGTATEDSLDGALENDLDTVLDYLVHSEVASPRQVRVIVNEFSMALNVASQREQASGAHLAHHPLTRNKPLLAKIVVLRVHYPWFYELLSAEPELLVSAEDRVTALSLHSQESEVDTAARERVAEAAARAVGERAQFEEGRERHEGPEAVDTSSATGEAASSTTNRLLASLESYLFRTAETVVGDSVQVEEFIYLRAARSSRISPGRKAPHTGERFWTARRGRSMTSRLEPRSSCLLRSRPLSRDSAKLEA